MCRISSTIGSPKTYMKSGGTKTFEEVLSNGVHLVHEWLPIQTDPSKVKNPIIEWSDGSKVLFNGELFGHDRCDDMELIRSFDGLDPLIDYLSSDADGFWSMIIDLHTHARKDHEGEGSKEIIAVVDPLSKKQLYYKKGVGVSSEIKALLTPEDQIDESHLTRTIKWGYVTDESTPFASIKRVMPNTIMRFSEDFENIEVVRKNYRDLSPKLLSDSEFKRAMSTSVKNRLAGHVPVSLLLSGGLDSSIISAHLSQMGQPVTSYCIENEEDLAYAQMVDPHVKTLSLDESSLEEALKIMEMPIDLGSMVPQCALAKTVESVVVLTGDGADEVFGGYRRMFTYDAQLSDVFEELPFYHHVRLDRMSAGFTREIRSPFLHLDIVRHGLALPYEERINKKYLRAIYDRDLPRKVLDRGKEPLKTSEIRQTTGEEYRAKIVQIWRDLHKNWCEEEGKDASVTA